ncbi:MAG: VanZ family protein [Acidobacteriota bacterium]|nr:VanZ family protein [Acidobacteriota bacterium]
MRRFLESLGLWLPLAFYVGLIYFLSSQSTIAWARYYPDSLLHGIEFFLLAALVLRALNGGLLIPVPPRCYLWTFVLSSHYALLDEIHQALVPGRVASVLDLMADMVGIDLALAAVFILQRALVSRRVSAARG